MDIFTKFKKRTKLYLCIVLIICCSNVSIATNVVVQESDDSVIDENISIESADLNPTTNINNESDIENVAENVIENSTTETEELSEEELEKLREVEEQAKEIYTNSIAKAILDASFPEVINLPSPFRQPTYHPMSTDFFGVDADTSPIFTVDMEGKDESEKNCMALTFDSAYINKYTYKILDILDQYDVKATFFMTYEFMTKNVDQVGEIILRGHEIGNHSMTHPDLNKKTDAEVAAEIWKPHSFIRNKFGVEMCLFRFPFGSYSPRTVAILKNFGYYPIQWTFDSIDWKNLGTEYLINRFESTDCIGAGHIILFHNGATYTPEALPHIIEKIKNAGLKCVRVSDLIYKNDFRIKNSKGVQYSIK